MGIYINPKDGEKQAFLSLHGKSISVQDARLHDCDRDRENVVVCLVDNVAFQAAGVCDSNRERDAFDLPEDRRRKKWFLVQLCCLTEQAGLSDKFPEEYRARQLVASD
jgi:hypothetical protein